jgi:MFS family permease
MDALVYQYLIPVLVAALGLSLVQAGTVASANYFASAIGGWLAGWLCDRFGRARVLRLTILWFAVFSFLSGFARSYEQLLLIRTLQGLGFGGEWAVGAVLLGEMVAPSHRAKAVGVVHAAAALGSGLAAVLAGPVVAWLPPGYGWRVVFWVGLLPALLVFFVRRDSDDSAIYKQARQRIAAGQVRAPKAGIFSPPFIGTTLAASLLAVGAQGAGFVVSNYLTTFLQHERALSASASGVYVLVNSAGGFCGFLVNAYSSDRVGRRRIFRLFGVGFICAVVLYLYAPLDGGRVWMLLPAGFVYGFFQFGIYASFGPYFTELFPTEVRGTGQAFAYNVGRAASGLFIHSAAVLASVMPLSMAMLITAVAGILCAVTATFLLPETAGRELISLSQEDRCHGH